jgi:hypothetical protein
METLFILTQTIMLICLVSIVLVSITGRLEIDRIEKTPGVASVFAKVKLAQINTANISRITTALLTILLR